MSSDRSHAVKLSRFSKREYPQGEGVLLVRKAVRLGRVANFSSL